MSASSHRVAIVVAVIGVIGTLGAALIGNWDKMFPSKRASAVDSPSQQRLDKAPPDEVVRELLRASNEGDRDAALTLAEPSAVDTLFSASSLDVNTKDLTCYPAGTSQRHCQMSHTKGIVVFRLLETDRGWWVEGVEY